MVKFGVCKVLALLAVAALLSTGCQKKPKLNLAHLRDASNGGAAMGAGDADNFIAGDNGGDVSVDPFDNNGNGAGNGWSGLDSPVAVGDAAAYLNNAKAWNEKVYFDYNRYEIKASQRQVLDRLAEHLNQNAGLAVVIEGHCDERGSDEYNRSLSERRALAIRDYLNALGIDNGRMFTLSYGEDKPDVPNASTEEEHKLNRRGQFLVGDKK